MIFELVLTVLLLCVVVYIATVVSKNHQEMRSLPAKFLARLKIFLGFYGTLSAILEKISFLHLPRQLMAFGEFVDFAQLSFLNLLSYKCFYPDPMLNTNAYVQLIMTVAWNLVIPAAVALFYVIRRSYTESEVAKMNLKERCIKVTVLLLFTIYPTTCMKILQVTQ